MRYAEHFTEIWARIRVTFGQNSSERLYPESPQLRITIQTDRPNIFFLTKGRGSSGTGLNGVDAETGQRKFFDEQFDFGNSLMVGDMMIILSGKGELIWGEGEAAFRETYRQKILDGLCWAKPFLIGNLLSTRNAEGTVVCHRLE